MTRGWLAVGAGVTSYTWTITLACHSQDLKSIPAIASIVTLATGILGLTAAKVCKSGNETLDRKDFILIGGASFIGSAAAVGTIAAMVALVYGLAIGSIYGTLIGVFLGNMLSMPFCVISPIVTRNVFL